MTRQAKMLAFYALTAASVLMVLYAMVIYRLQHPYLTEPQLFGRQLPTLVAGLVAFLLGLWARPAPPVRRRRRRR